MTGFSQNDVKVLLALLEDGFSSDTKMAKKVGLTVQAVGKIRKKLVQKGVIKGMSVELDMEKLGINVMAISFIKVSEGLKGQTSAAILKEIAGSSSSLCVLSLSSQSDGNLFVKSAFRNLKECESFFSRLEKEHGRKLEIKKLYVCSTDSILKDSRIDLFRQMLKDYTK